MSVWESVKTALKSIFANKMRSSLTMLGMVIGVCAVVLLVALGQGFQTSITNTFNNLGAYALYVSTSSDKTLTTVRPLTLDDATALTDKALAPAIGIVSPTINKSVTVQNGNNSDTVPATGILPIITQIKTYNIDMGRFITDQDVANRASVVVLGWQTEQDLFAGAGPERPDRPRSRSEIPGCRQYPEAGRHVRRWLYIDAAEHHAVQTGRRH